MRPVLMRNQRYNFSLLTPESSNGFGRLDAVECTVTEERNGIYDLSMSLPVAAKHFSEVANGSIIRVKVSDGTQQLFRVYRITKMMNGLAQIDAHHISYDLTKVPIQPFTATGITAALEGLLSNMYASYDFTIETDIDNTTSTFTLDIPRSFRECLGGYSGSILDVFGGVYEWDNNNVILHASRGSDKGLRISYGTNMTDLNQEANIENVYDAVLGYAQIDDVTAVGQPRPTGTAYPRVMIVDFSDDYDIGDTPTQEELIQKAQAYYDANRPNVPKVSIDVSFAPLWQSPEYSSVAPLQSVGIDDTVHVYYEALGVEASAKVVRTVWNVLLERFDEVGLGDTRTTLSEMIVGEALAAMKGTA